MQRLKVGQKYKIVSLNPEDSFLGDFKKGFFKDGITMQETSDGETCYKVYMKQTAYFYYLRFGAKFKKM